MPREFRPVLPESGELPGLPVPLRLEAGKADKDGGNTVNSQELAMVWQSLGYAQPADLFRKLLEAARGVSVAKVAALCACSDSGCEAAKLKNVWRQCRLCAWRHCRQEHERAAVPLSTCCSEWAALPLRATHERHCRYSVWAALPRITYCT